LPPELSTCQVSPDLYTNKKFESIDNSDITSETINDKNKRYNEKSLNKS